MKEISKDIILKNDMLESTLLEKEILLQADHPFLVGMSFVFHTEFYIYFISAYNIRNSVRDPARDLRWKIFHITSPTVLDVVWVVP